MDKFGKISGAQLAVLLLICRLFTIMTYVPLISEGSGLSVQLSAAIITVAIQAVTVFPLVLLSGKYPQKSVTGAALALDRRFGVITGVLFLLFFAFAAAGGILNFMQFITERFLPRDNAWVILLVFTAVCGYCAAAGVEGLARAGLPAAVIFAVVLLIMCITSAGSFSADNFYVSEGRQYPLFRAVSDDMLRNGEIVAAAYLMGRLNGRLRCGIYGFLAAKLVAGAAIAVLIAGVLGSYAARTSYPFLTVGAFTDGDYIQRNDAFYLIIWTLAAVITAAVFLRAAADTLDELLPKTDNESGRTYRLSFGAAGVIFLLTAGGMAFGEAFGAAESIICGGYAVILLVGAIPLIILLSGRKQRKAEEKVWA